MVRTWRWALCCLLIGVLVGCYDDEIVKLNASAQTDERGNCAGSRGLAPRRVPHRRRPVRRPYRPAW